ncbi:phosphatidylinositol-specific phospholipase [Xylogone sp. PMI_703]|nr:phosphatidylinositol-specific phospholipase [Xylogone sp. PMI_703]
MAWVARGKDHSGFVQNSSDGQSSTAPTIAAHRGNLWCLWSGPAGEIFYAIGDNNNFQSPLPFPDRGLPVVADVLGTLHAVVLRPDSNITHYIYDDVEMAWSPPTIINLGVGLRITSPALVSFHNKIVLAYVQDEVLMFSMWDPVSSNWTQPLPVSEDNKFRGTPALFILDTVLHVLCGSAAEDNVILGFAYDLEGNIWKPRDDVSEGKAARGVSATSYGDSAYLAFQENGPDDDSHSIFIAEYANGTWQPREDVDGQSSADPPQLAVLNGRINCIFNANNETKDLMWYSRNLLDYDLDSWMSNVPDDTLLSNMTIPGTHDTCALSHIPFVRTQYLTVDKQLEAGIRFLDLRCRVHDDGQLYMYHGGIPLNLPTFQKLESVMNEVFTFMTKDGRTPTETVLISINNDDTSGDKPHAVFYSAVKEHIENTPRYEDDRERWLTSRTTVTLGDARGRAVLLRRYQTDPDLEPPARIGIDLSGWLNNNPDFTLLTPDGVSITLQDKWQYSDIIPLEELIASKHNFVSSMLNKAVAGSPEEWFINFSSAVGDPVEKGEIAEAHWIAVGGHSHWIGKFIPGMNITMRRKSEWGTKTRYGIVPMDYPELPKDNDIISCLIGTNL